MTEREQQRVTNNCDLLISAGDVFLEKYGKDNQELKDITNKSLSLLNICANSIDQETIDSIKIQQHELNVRLRKALDKIKGN